MTDRSFRVFDVVMIEKSRSTMELELDGQEAVVLGITGEEESGVYWYAVQVREMETVMIEEADLIATGRSVEPGDIYDGSSIRVRQDGTLSEGQGTG